MIQVGGKTLDLTLFTATRALDVIVGELWSQHRARRQAARKWNRAEQFASHMIDPAVFVTSCAFIMWSWFYHPNNLPRNYNKWITSAASVDQRLIDALRTARLERFSMARIRELHRYWAACARTTACLTNGVTRRRPSLSHASSFTWAAVPRVSITP